jgi:hypothetical protein
MKANQMVVLMRPRIEPCRRTRVTDLRDQGQSDQGIEDAIHGGSGNGVDAFSSLVIDLVGCGMILSVEDHLKDGPSLHGYGKAPLVAESFEPFNPLLFGLAIHGRLRWHVVPSGMMCQWGK